MSRVVRGRPSLPSSASIASLFFSTPFASRRARHAPVPAAAMLAVALSGLPAMQPAIAAEPLRMGPVTITATRLAQPVRETAASVTVLERADLVPFATRSAEDILVTLAGVTVARSGGPGQQASIFLRGTDSDATLVLVDGVKFNAGTFGLAPLQNLRGEDIESIEVLRGPRGTLYGSEAIGGVISITTRRPQASSAEFTLSGSDNATVEAHAAASHVQGDDRLRLGIGRYDSDGDAIIAGIPVDGAHRNDTATFAAQTKLGAATLETSLSGAQGRTRYLDTFALAALEQDFRNTVAAASARLPAGENGTVLARLGWSDDALEQVQPNFLGQFDRAQTTRESAALEYHRNGTRHRLVAGAETEREQVDALSYGTTLDEANDMRALFARDGIRVGEHGELGLGARYLNHDAFGDHGTGEASYGHTLAQVWHAWGSWSTGFRAPDAGERFGFGGNPQLQPETSAAVELGLRRQLGAHELSLAGFRQDIDDLIDFPAPAFTATNIDRARITGAELGWRWRNTHWQADALAIVQDPEDRTSGAQLSRRPNQQLTGNLRRALTDTLWLGGDVLAMDARDNSRYDAIVLPGVAVFGLALDWQARPELALGLRLDNVGDHDYALAADAAGDYAMPGRTLSARIAWQPRF